MIACKCYVIGTKINQLCLLKFYFYRNLVHILKYNVFLLNCINNNYDIICLNKKKKNIKQWN